MIAFFILNASAAVTAWQVATRIARLPSFVLRCIAGGLTWFSVIVLGELLLGLLGQLTLTNLMIEQAIFACIACAVARSIPVDRAGPGPLYGAWPGFLGRRRVILLLACVLLGFGVVKAGINLVNPPFGWDSLNYHFTFPVEWMKTGTLENPITVSDDPSPPYYPINGSLLYLWLLWPFSGAFAADLGQLPFYLLGFACVYRIAGKFRLSPEYAFYAAALFTLIPNYFKQIEIAYVDVMVSSLFCAACVFLMELQERFDRRNVLFFGMSAGLLLGTKTVAVAYSILLFPAFAYLVLRHRRKAYYGIYAFLAVVMLGGFSYIRNMAVTGNPLYPFDSGLFRGVMDKATYAAHFTVADYNPGKLLFHEGLGGAVLLFVLPAVFIGLPVALWRDKKITPLGAYMTAVAPAIYLLYRFVIPLANTRYLYPAFAVGMATAFYAAQLLNVPRAVIRVLTVLCVLAAVPELAGHGELIASLCVTFALWFLIPPLMRLPGRVNLSRVMLPAGLGAGVVCMVFTGILSRDYRHAEYARYIAMEEYSGFWPDATRAWKWLNDHTSSHRIAYVGRPVPYPLYGTAFKNEVFYVSVNGTEPAKLHYYPRGRYRWGGEFASMHENLRAQGNYRAAADYAVWLRNLMRRRADFLFVYSLHQTREVIFPIEDAWAREHPGIFEPVFENDTIHIYRIAAGNSR